MSFSTRLKEEIEFADLRYKELAEKSGVPERALYNYVATKNPSMPPADVAVKIATALGVTVEYLVTGKKESQNKQSEFAELQQTIKEILSIPNEQFKPIREIIHNTADLCRGAVRQGR